MDAFPSFNPYQLYGMMAAPPAPPPPPPTPEEAMAGLKAQTHVLARLVSAGTAAPEMVAQVRADVQRRALQLLDAAPAFSARNGIHSSYLWKHTIYAAVSELRSALKKACHPAAAAAAGSNRRERVLSPEYAELAKQLQEVVNGASRTLGALLTSFLALLGIDTSGAGVAQIAAAGMAPLVGSDAKYVSAASCMLLIYLGDLTRYAAEYPLPTHPVRVTPGTGISELWETAIGAYIQASLLEPKSGHPHNQLAVVAKETRAARILALRFMRSQASAAPFAGVREELQAAFESNRQLVEALASDPRIRRMGAVSAAHLVQDAYLIVSTGKVGEGALGRASGRPHYGGGGSSGSGQQAAAASSLGGRGAGAGASASSAVAGAAASAATGVGGLFIALVPRSHPAVVAGLPPQQASPLIAADGSTYYPPPPSSSSQGGYVPTAADSQYHLLRGSVLERPWEALGASTAFPPLAAYLPPGQPGALPVPLFPPPRTALPLRRALLTWTAERTLRMAGMISLGTDLDRLPPLVREACRDVSRLVSAAVMEDANSARQQQAASSSSSLGARTRPPLPTSGPVLPAGFLLRQATMLLWAAHDVSVSILPTGYQPTPDDVRRAHVRSSYARFALLLFASSVAKSARKLFDAAIDRRRLRKPPTGQMGQQQRQQPKAASSGAAAQKNSNIINSRRRAPEGAANQNADTQPIVVDEDDNSESEGSDEIVGGGGSGSVSGKEGGGAKTDGDDEDSDSSSESESEASDAEDSRGGAAGVAGLIAASQASNIHTAAAAATAIDAASSSSASARAPLPPHVLPTLNACLAALSVVCDWLSSPANKACLEGPIDLHLTSPPLPATGGKAAQQKQQQMLLQGNRRGQQQQLHKGGRGAHQQPQQQGRKGGKQPTSAAAILAEGDPDKLLSYARRMFLEALAGLSNRLVRTLGPQLAGSSPAVLRLLAGVVPGLSDFMSGVPPVDVFPHVAAGGGGADVSGAGGASTPAESSPTAAASSSSAPAAAAPLGSDFVRPALVEEVELRGFGVAPFPSLYDKLPLPYVPLRRQQQLNSSSGLIYSSSSSGGVAYQQQGRSLPGDVALVLFTREGASYSARAEPPDFNGATHPAPAGCLQPLTSAECLGVRMVKVLRTAGLLATSPACVLSRQEASGKYVTSSSSAGTSARVKAPTAEATAPAASAAKGASAGRLAAQAIPPVAVPPSSAAASSVAVVAKAAPATEPSSVVASKPPAPSAASSTIVIGARSNARAVVAQQQQQQRQQISSVAVGALGTSVAAAAPGFSRPAVTTTTSAGAAASSNGGWPSSLPMREPLTSSSSSAPMAVEDAEDDDYVIGEVILPTAGIGRPSASAGGGHGSSAATSASARGSSIIVGGSTSTTSTAAAVAAHPSHEMGGDDVLMGSVLLPASALHAPPLPSASSPVAAHGEATTCSEAAPAVTAPVVEIRSIGHAAEGVGARFMATATAHAPAGVAEADLYASLEPEEEEDNSALADDDEGMALLQEGSFIGGAFQPS